MKEAKFYRKLDNKIECLLCPQECIIAEKKTGLCRVRKNINGILYATTYGKISSINLDPIEKKPLYHFYPGSKIISLGAIGCNLKCNFCQNWHISQEDAPLSLLSPSEAVEIALKYKENIGISYTYNEPLIWYEYVLDVAKLAKEKNLKNVLVTNGFLKEEPLRELLPFIDAANIDLKSFNFEFYKKICKGKLDSVLEAIKIFKEYCFVEITNLIIPTLNDSLEEIENLVFWIAENLGKDTPVHFSRYFPNYKLTLPPTPLETLEKAYNIATKKLDFVYLGNVWDREKSSTFCPGCKELLIERQGYNTRIVNLEGNTCKNCKRKISGVFEQILSE